jgi:hypothetical protein
LSCHSPRLDHVGLRRLEEGHDLYLAETTRRDEQVEKAKATNISSWQSGQRTRAKPWGRSPHLRKVLTLRSTTVRQKPLRAANRSSYTR